MGQDGQSLVSSLIRWQLRPTIVMLGLSILLSVLGVFRPGYYTDPSVLVQLYCLQNVTFLPVVLAGVLSFRYLLVMNQPAID